MIGRNESCAEELRTQKALSTYHCYLIADGHGQVRAVDMHSFNGTYVNEEPITPFTPTVITADDTLRCAQFTFSLVPKPD